MPFDLKLRHVPRGGGVGWEMEGPSWLTLATLPFEASCIREVMDDSWCRDRYAPITAEELLAWHRRVWAERDVETADVDTRRTYDRFVERVERADPFELFILHWHEWESGRN